MVRSVEGPAGRMGRHDFSRSRMPVPLFAHADPADHMRCLPAGARNTYLLDCHRVIGQAKNLTWQEPRLNWTAGTASSPRGIRRLTRPDRDRWVLA